MGTRSLSTLSGIAARRRNSLPLTSVILAELLQRSAPSTIAFAAVGVREGYVFSRMSSKTIADDPLTAGARAISLRDSRYGDTSGVFMDWLTPLLPREKKARIRLQKSVCALADMAWREHPDYRATYAFERSIQYPFLGISHTECLIALSLTCATVASPKTKSSRRTLAALETSDPPSRKAGARLRLAYRISGGSPNR